VGVIKGKVFCEKKTRKKPGKLTFKYFWSSVQDLGLFISLQKE
jgi:hypothetical protein